LLLRGERIVVPRELRERVLNIAHETHQGIVRTKQFIRSRFFWPNMDEDVTQMIGTCTSCVLNQPLQEDTPLQPTEPAPRPWSKVAIDIVGPIEIDYLLTMIDYFSSYPFAVVIKDISSTAVIEVLERVFSEHGFPDGIVTDNGRQFVSTQFTKYLHMAGVTHIRSSPYFPKSNGKIERFHRFLKKSFRTATVDGKDWKRQLPRILQTYRATAHRATGETPSMLFLNRSIKTKLPVLYSVKPDPLLSKKLKYAEKMKTYADEKRGARHHTFDEGDIVYVANFVRGKLQPTYNDVKHVILKRKQRDTFQIVNCTTGVISVRNAKYLRHVPCVESVSDLNPDADTVSRELVPDRAPHTHVALPVPEPVSIAAATDRTDERLDTNNTDVGMDNPVSSIPDIDIPVVEEPRRSTRQRRPPRHLQDYVSN